jgi:Na+/pantothenate symporter
MTMIDVIFGIIMAVGASVLFTDTLQSAGGWNTVVEKLSAIKPQLVEWIGPPGLWPLFCLVFLTSVAPFAMPQLVQKFYAIRDKKAIRLGMIASTLFSVLISGTAYFTGATARLFLRPDNAPSAFENGKPIFDALMPELLTNVVPPSLSVLMLLLILSASMSTLAALVLISSSSLAKDIYAGFIRKDVSDKHLTILMRVSSAFFVVISTLLAYFKPATIVAILGISWGAIGSAFLGPFFWGLLSKRMNRVGAVVSSVGGLGLCLFLYATGTPSPQAGTIGMIASLVLNPLVSTIYPERKSDE